ncbi:MAG: hypothetical protein O7E54_00730 [Planctomycetota bacterium]|nr:hypothetical protein [Planctomycetota bacterium]
MGKKRISIRTSLARNLTLLILVPAGILILTSRDVAGKALDALSHKIIEANARETVRKLNEFFEPPAQSLQMLADWARLRPFGIDPGDTHALNEIFVPIMKRFPQISSINMGDSEGNGYMVMIVEGGWRNRIARASTWSKTLWESWEDFTLRPRQWWQEDDYDPRGQPWFLSAVGGDGVFWTEPYQFRTTRELGITASVRVRHKDGRVQIIAFDMLLEDLSNFTRSLAVADNGRVIITTDGDPDVEDSGFQTIGLPRDPRFDSPEARKEAFLKIPADLGIPMLVDAAEAARERYKQEHRQAGSFPFPSKDEIWWAGIRPYQLGEGHVFWILIAVPETDLLGDIYAERVRIIGVILATLGIALWIGFVTARSYSRPLKDLVAATDRLQTLDLKDKIEVDTKLEEVGQLADSSERARSAIESFSLYVPTEVVRQLMQRGEAARIGGRAATLTIMFTDVRDFTSIAERMSPVDLTLHMGEYFEGMLDTLRGNGGTIDKIVGDAIVAFWGAPNPDPQQVPHATEAALRCRERLVEWNRAWKERGLPELPTGLGLATGEVVVGNIGAPSRLTYTALGDTMNVASRVEGLTRRYGTDILVTGDIRRRAGEGFVWREVDLVAVKGRRKAVEIFELLGRTGEVDQQLLDWAGRYQGALAFFYARDFAKARELLEGLDHERPEDASVQIMMKRCHDYIETPPPEDWDGIARLQYK